MDKEEVESVPSGLVTCLVGEKEVHLLKMSPQKLIICIDEAISNHPVIKVAFYQFNAYSYEEIILKDYDLIEETKDRFSFVYAIYISHEGYRQSVLRVIKDYSTYIILKNEGQDNEFSKKMVGYPSELDHDFNPFYLHDKMDWMSEISSEKWPMHQLEGIELAVLVEHNKAYEKYMELDKKQFMAYYLQKNFAEHIQLFQKDISRIYIGNEFCHLLFPDEGLLLDMMDKAKLEALGITLCFTYIRECYIEKTKALLEKVYSWCQEKNTVIEVVINDWGMLKLIEDKNDYFKGSLGVLLNKQKKDPRYGYQKGYLENKARIGKNDLNSEVFHNFLEAHHIKRYEYENCGYQMTIAKGHHSLHMPFYVTNVSQYCPLHAMCTSCNRGHQKLVEKCPQYCTDYVFAYPKHLKMIGRYNGLFAFDEHLLKDPEKLVEYAQNGIDRVVLNFI